MPMKTTIYVELARIFLIKSFFTETLRFAKVETFHGSTSYS